jgi:hypothetical protein
MSELFKAGVRRTPPELIVKVPVPKEQKKEKTPTYNLTWEQIQQMKKDAAKEAVGTVIELTLGIPAMVLKDKYGFGKKRLPEALDHMVDLYESYEQGYLTLQDIRRTLWEEGRYKIEKRDIWRRTR